MRQVPGLLGVDSRWSGRIVFLQHDYPGEGVAALDSRAGTIWIGVEGREDDVALTSVVAHELTHALAKGQWIDLLPRGLMEGVATWVGGRVSGGAVYPHDWIPTTEEVREMLLLSHEEYERSPDRGYFEQVGAWYVDHLGINYVRGRAQSGEPFHLPRKRFLVTHYGVDGAMLSESHSPALPLSVSTPEGTVRTEAALRFVPGELAVP